MTTATQSWLDTVNEGVRLRREQLQRERSRPVLTASAWIDLAFRYALTTKTQVESFLKLLHQGSSQRFPETRMTLRMMTEKIPWPYNRPIPEVRRLSFFDPRGYAVQESAPIGASGILFFQAVAGYIASQEKPKAFGQLDNYDDWLERGRVIAARLNAIAMQILNEVSGDQLMLPHSRGGDPTFRLSGHVVPIWPREDAGERLIAHLSERADYIA